MRSAFMLAKTLSEEGISQHAANTEMNCIMEDPNRWPSAATKALKFANRECRAERHNRESGENPEQARYCNRRVTPDEATGISQFPGRHGAKR